MPTAEVVVEQVDGYVGPARCYRLDPPVVIEGREYEHVTVVVQPPFAHQAAETKVYPAHKSGAAATLQLTRRVGSHTLRDDYRPGDVAYEDGVRALALILLGGYQVVAP